MSSPDATGVRASNADSSPTAEFPSKPTSPLARRVRRVVRRVDLRVQLGRVAVLALFLGIWAFGIEREWVRPLYSATPGAVATGMAELATESEFWRDLVVTLREALGGWAIGSSVGLVTGLILGYWERLAKVMAPFLTLGNAAPKVAFAPVLVLWFGIGESSKVVLAAVIVYFIVQVSTQSAVAMVDPDLQKVVTTMGAKEWQRFQKVILPGTLSAVFGALRLSAVYSILGVVLAEFIASRQGLGQRLISATNRFDLETAFSIIVVLALLALALNGVIGLAERRFLGWRESGRKGDVVAGW